MVLSEFYEAVEEKFGRDYGKWIVSTHVLEKYGKTALELLSTDTRVRDIWEALEQDFKN
ncbi:MAG: DUF3046 domain-containing protein [Corynebacterium sp.]|nr:DUF3046 domain-containing protein [Corynebacterium sp.]